MSPQQRANFIICQIAAMKTLAEKITRQGLGEGYYKSLRRLSDELKGVVGDKKLAEQLMSEYQQLKDIVDDLR